LDAVSKFSGIIDKTLVYTPKTQEIHDICQRNCVPYLNHPETMRIFASKFATYQAVQETGIRQPFTTRISTQQQYQDYLETKKNGEKIVIKPEWGGMGTNVYFVKKVSANIVEVSWKTKAEEVVTSHQERFTSSDFYNSYISPIIPDLSGDSRSSSTQVSWIAQEFLDLSGDDGCAQDIRVIEQRDESGRLVVAKIHGRKSNSTSIPLSNIDKGGKVCDAHDILEGTCISMDEVVETCRTVDAKVEQKTNKPIGEVGHDLAVITENGRCKLVYIEGNTMPGYILDKWEDIQKFGPHISLLSNCDCELIYRPIQYMDYQIRHNMPVSTPFVSIP
jgi:hypothetical protein